MRNWVAARSIGAMARLDRGRAMILLAAALLGLLFIACGRESLPSPSPGPDSRAPGVSGPLAIPVPTPHPDNSLWVRQRVDAVIDLYSITDAGAAMLRSLDVRQMRGDPGFFGSFGFNGWAGVGEARPGGVMHELGHSYWGGFPVEGFPELTWDAPSGKKSPAMQQYHQDILAFMAQPPDDYELLRQRLRNLPDLSSDNLEPLLHHVEADLVHTTGGNLSLAPPILRKYWSRFLQDGPFASWYDAAGWYQSLPDQDRALANKYLGFEHLDLRQYRSLDSSSVGADLLHPRRETLEREERQRLFDLADQFDLLLGDPQKEENFQFWRGYLRDKIDLQRAHPDYLDSVDLPRAADLASALEFLAGLSGQPPAAQARQVRDRLADQPFLVNFLPALDNRTLLELFDSDAPLPEGATLRATASFVQRLDRFSGAVDQILAAGREDPRRGASELQEFLAGMDFEQVEDLRLFFELFRDVEYRTASRVVQALDPEVFRRLMKPVPFHLRTLLAPADLLAKLGITAEAETSALKQGITTLVDWPSGNFIVDEPFLYQMYEVIARRSEAQPQAMARVVGDTLFPLEGFIQRQPRAAVDMLGSDLETAVALVQQSDPVLSPPARIIYRLIYADPVLAARLVLALEDAGETALVVESLAYPAYDKPRSERVSGLPISLEQDGKLLAALLQQRGAGWLAQRLGEAFSAFGSRADRGEVAPDFLDQYRATLEAAAGTLSDAAARSELQGAIAQAAAAHNTGR